MSGGINECNRRERGCLESHAAETTGIKHSRKNSVENGTDPSVTGEIARRVLSEKEHDTSASKGSKRAPSKYTFTGFPRERVEI